MKSVNLTSVKVTDPVFASRVETPFHAVRFIFRFVILFIIIQIDSFEKPFSGFLATKSSQRQQMAADLIGIAHSRLDHALGHAAADGQLIVEASVIADLGQQGHHLRPIHRAEIGHGVQILLAQSHVVVHMRGAEASAYLAQLRTLIDKATVAVTEIPARAD